MLPGFFFFLSFFFFSLFSTGPVFVHKLVVLVTLVLGIMRVIYIIDFRNGIMKKEKIV